MPADDLVLNVRQIAGFPPASSASPTDAIIVQRGGLGGPYVSLSPAALVGTALAQGGDMAINGALSALSIKGGALQFSNGAFGLLGAQKTCFVEMDATWGTIAGVPIATVNDIAVQRATSVSSVNGRVGDIKLDIGDICGGAPLYSPRFTGEPRCDTPWPGSNSTRLATTGFVHRNAVEYITHLLSDHPFVFTFNGRSGDVVLTEQDILNAGGGTVFDSPAFTGVPTAPTAAPGTSTTQLATTEFVTAAIAGSTIWAPLDSPEFTGNVTGPTAPPGTADGQFATTAFVTNAVTEATTGVASFNGRTGTVVLAAADVEAVGGALTVSPAFTGTPTGPTAAPGTATAQFATTAFVMNELADEGVLTFNGRSGDVTLTSADLTGAGGALAASPAFTGVPTAPTAAPGVNTTQLATTAFVTAAVLGSVASFNGRTGAVNLIAADISAAGGAALASPAFTGTPTAPTASPGTNSGQIATTAYVTAALAAGGGVQSFNGRAGAVTLTAADVNASGALAAYLPLTGGTLTGALNGTSGSFSGAVAGVSGNFTSLAVTNAAALTGGVIGVTNGSAAPAGTVGETIVGVASGLSFGVGATANVTQVTLTPGSWLILGYVNISLGGFTMTAYSSALSLTSATFPSIARTFLNGFSGASIASFPTPPMTANVTVNTVIYLVAVWQGTAGPATVGGQITAVRIR